MAEKRKYILYDDRACGGSTDDASVLEMCDTNEEACEAKGKHGNMACFSYDILKTLNGQPDRLINEEFEWNYP